MSIIRRAWKGEAPLGIVFWVYGLVLPLLIVFGIAFLIELKTQYTDLLVWGLVGFLVLYLPWMYVSIWRCAKNSSRLWKVVARVWVVLCICSIPAKAIPRYVELERSGKAKQNVASAKIEGWQQAQLTQGYMSSITKDHCVEKTVISLAECNAKDCYGTLAGIYGDCITYAGGSKESFCRDFKKKYLDGFCGDRKSLKCNFFELADEVFCKN